MTAVDGAHHLSVLEVLDGTGNISQRSMADRLGVAASLVNRVIHELMEGGHLEIVDAGVRPFAYKLTDAGRNHLRRLIHQRFRTVLEELRVMQSRISRRLQEVRAKGVGRLLFYGAGEVLDATIPLAEELGFEVVGVVDDDPEKQGTSRGGHLVSSPNCIGTRRPDAVLITTYRHAEQIRNRLEGRLPPGIRVLEL